MTTRRVNAVNGDLEEEWERDPRDDMVFEYDEVLDSDDASTLLADEEPLTFDGEMGRLQDELVNGEPSAFNTQEEVDEFERFVNLRGSYSSPPPPVIRRTQRFEPDSPMTPPTPTSPIRPRRISFYADDDFIVPVFSPSGSRRFIRYESASRSSVLKKVDPDFKRKYEENGGDEYYKPSMKKMKADREFWVECADELIEPYSDSE